MCYRFYIDLFFKRKVNKLMAEKGIFVPDRDLGKLILPRDVHPTETALVIAGVKDQLAAGPMNWGFASPVDKGVLANARAESVKEKYSFSDSFMKRRCVIPTSGFYEWNTHKARFKFYREDEEPVMLAGIYRVESGISKFTVLTREAAGSMIGIHDRMPVILTGEEIHQWIRDDDYATDFYKREPGELMREQDDGQISMDFGI